MTLVSISVVNSDYTIRVFSFGDIEFLTKLYGLSGSAGDYSLLALK